MSAMSAIWRHDLRSFFFFFFEFLILFAEFSAFERLASKGLPDRLRTALPPARTDTAPTVPTHRRRVVMLRRLLRKVTKVESIFLKNRLQKKGLDLAIPTPAMVLLTCLQPRNSARLNDSLHNLSGLRQLQIKPNVFGLFS